MPVSSIAAQLRRKVLATVANVIDGIGQMPCRPVFQQISIRSRPHHFADDFVVHCPGQNNDLGPEAFPAYSPNQLDAVHHWQVQIDNRDIGTQIADFIQRRLAVGTARQYLDFSVLAQNSGKPVAPQRILVGQQDRYFLSIWHDVANISFVLHSN
jgi:hypothetical protein